MRYNLSEVNQLEKAIQRLKVISGYKNPVADIKAVHKKRTLKQNAYLHVLFSLYGLNFGYTVEEAKAVVKVALGYTYEKNGFVFLVQTRKMNSRELTDFIERFRNYSSYHGCYLPRPNEVTDEILNEIEVNRNFLEAAF